MPRILSVSHSYVVALNRRLAHELVKSGREGWEFTAVAPRSFEGDLRFIPAEPETTRTGLQLEQVGVLGSRSPHLFLYGVRLREFLNQRFDLVHAWEEPYVLAGSQIAAWTPRASKLVFWSFQNIAKNYPPPFGVLERFAVQRSDGVIPGGITVAQTLATKASYSGRIKRTLTLGVDVDLFAPSPERGTATRGRLGWVDHEPSVVGYLGRFVEEKGLPLLCRVLERTSQPWRALFVGGGPLEIGLRRWADRYGDRVRIVTGVPHDEVPEYLNAMDVLCAPSQTTPTWREQVGRMLLEALASGVPVIGSSSGEIPHTIGDAGLLVGETDEDAWGLTLERLLADPEERRRLAASGLERAHAKFAWPVIARGYLRVFEEILSTGTSHASP
jgi:glycosyltransferase involved in cell wall biosynthesis